MMGVFVTDIFLSALNLSLCVLNVINENYVAACISAATVIWCVCFAARALKCHLDYMKIRKGIEKEYAEQRKAFEHLMSPFSTWEEYGGNWYRWTYKKEPNIYHGRIAHLAFRHKKARVRKKNMKRILKGK